MFPHLRPVLAIGFLLVSSLLAQGGDPITVETIEPIRMAVGAFGTEAEVEVRDLPVEVGREAVQAALAEIYEIDLLSDADGAAPLGVGTLNRAAGEAAVPIDPRVADLLLRSQQFCIWSGGAYGPLGGLLEDLWRGTSTDPLTRPTPAELRQAVGAAECSRLDLRAGQAKKPSKTPLPTAKLAPRSRVSLTGIARGYAVDRAMAVLTEHGVTNAWVEIGHVWRARGPGPEGRGWPAVLPSRPGDDQPIDRLWLRDQALVLLTAEAFDDGTLPAPVDQRTGVPVRGVVILVAVSRLAVDTQPLAHGLFILGHREGQMRLGSLDPRPSVYWLLGEGRGAPLEANYRWFDLDRVRKP